MDKLRLEAWRSERACDLSSSRCRSLNPAVWRLHSVAFRVLLPLPPPGFEKFLMGPTTPYTISSWTEGTMLVLLGTVKQCLSGSRAQESFFSRWSHCAHAYQGG